MSAVVDPQLVLPDPLFARHSGWPYITVISESGFVNLADVTGALATGGGSFRWYLSWGYSEVATLADEGVTWIRGWHDRDSAEAKALLAAFTLRRSAT
jgi:hypothetical protein